MRRLWIGGPKCGGLGGVRGVDDEGPIARWSRKGLPGDLCSAPVFLLCVAGKTSNVFSGSTRLERKVENKLEPLVNQALSPETGRATWILVVPSI